MDILTWDTVAELVEQQLGTHLEVCETAIIPGSEAGDEVVQQLRGKVAALAGDALEAKSPRGMGDMGMHGACNERIADLEAKVSDFEREARRGIDPPQLPYTTKPYTADCCADCGMHERRCECN